jgi:phage-related baseplate assembly protein
MPVSLAELTTPLTVDEVKTSIYNVLAAVGVPTTSWKPGAVVRTIITATAVMVSALSELMANIAKSGFLELAEGDWLTLTARYVFGVERIEATFASGEITLTNSGGGLYNFDPGDLVVLYSASSTKPTYHNTTTFTLNPSSSITVPVEAIETGAASTAPPGAIDTLVTTLVGVTVTNANPVIGLDAETDPALRTRCLEKLSALSPNGPAGAYEFFAKTAKRQNGETIGVTRVRVTPNSTTAHVTVTVAGPSGGISGTAGDPSTDLGAINLAIQTNVVPDGVTATVQSATPLSVDVTYTAWVYSTISLTSLEIQNLIAAKLTSFMSTQPVGGNIIPPAAGMVFRDAIVAAIAATRAEIFHVTVAVPAADVAVADTEVPVLGTVTPTINLVAP